MRLLNLLPGLLLSTSLYAQEPQTPAAPRELIRIEKYNCTQLMAESDDARGSALLFYYGYALGQRKVAAYQPPQMALQLQRVIDICKRNPDMPVNVAFATTLDG